MAPIFVQGKPLAIVEKNDADLTIGDDSDEISGYVYDPLPGPDFVRVLELLPGEGESDLQCSITPLCLDDSQQFPYRAISYTWQESEYDNLVISGTRADFPGPREKYSIRHPIWCDGRRILISTNLRDALRRFREEDLGLRLWIDAVCINQEDLEERSQQVLLMPRIYHSALNVWFWLGESDESSTIALEWIWKINDAKAHAKAKDETSEASSRFNIKDAAALQEIGLLPIESPPWKALIHFFQRPVFQRIWIVQELVTGRDVISRCGDTILDNIEIKSAVDFITRQSWDSELSDYYCDGKNIFQCIDVIKNIEEEWYLNRYNVRPRLVLATRDFQSTDPRDKVYALMGLFNDFAHREADHLHHGDEYQRPMDKLAEEFDFITVNRTTEGEFHDFATAIARAMRELIIHQAEIEYRQCEESDAQVLRESTDENVVNVRNRLVDYLLHSIPAIIESTRQDLPDIVEDNESQSIEPLMRSFRGFRPLNSYSLEENVNALAEGINSLSGNNAVHGFAEHVITTANSCTWRVQQLQGIGDAAEKYIYEIYYLESMLRHFLRLLGRNLPPPPPPPQPPQLGDTDIVYYSGNDGSESESEYSSSSAEIEPGVEYSSSFADIEPGVRFCDILHERRTTYDPGEFCCSHMAGRYVVSCSSYDERFFTLALDSIARSTLPPFQGCFFSEHSWRLLKALFGDLSEWDRRPKVVGTGSLQLGEDGTELIPNPNHWAKLDEKWLGNNFIIPQEKPEVGRVNKAPLQHWSWSPSISRMPDYRLSVEEIYREFTVRCLMDDADLFILSTIEDPSLTILENLPSWVPDFSTPLARKILLFPELDVRIPYLAGGEGAQQVKWSDDDPNVILLQAHQFDSVVYVTDVNILGSISSVIEQATELIRKQTDAYPTSEHKTDALCRTLIANCSTGPVYEYPAPESFPEYFEEFQLAGLENLKIDDDRGAGKETERSNTAKLFFDAAKRVMKGRVFFITRKGYFGVGPMSTKPGDKVSILEGGRLPFVIRTRGDPTGSEISEPQRYQFIGECYCHGICEGQALDLEGFEWGEIAFI